MKKIILILCLFIPVLAWAQSPVIISQPYLFQKYITTKDSILKVNNDQDTLASRRYVRNLLISAGSLIPGGAITSLPTVGFNPGTSLSASDFIKNVFYASQPPTASLTGGTVYELTVSNKTHNLNFSYGRQSATNTIATAVVNPGSFNVFGSQPSQPGTVSGTQGVTTTANTNTTYTLTVTTSDSKVATSSTSDTFLPRFFYFRSANSAPTSSDILAFAGGSNPLQSGHAIGPVTIIASGSNYPAFSYASNLGTVTTILDVNGFNVTSAFNVTTVSLTNSQGYTQNYSVYTLNSATSSNYTITTN